MKLNNKGFSLVELLVAIAIASIVILAASRFLSSILQQYNKDTYDIKLQTEVEEILNLLENWLMDAIEIESASDGKTMSVVKPSEDDAEAVFTSNVYMQDGNIYYTNQSSKKIYLGTHVKDVDFSLSETGKSVFVTVSMEFGTSKYKAVRKILLRNSTDTSEGTLGDSENDNKNDGGNHIIDEGSKAEGSKDEGGNDEGGKDEGSKNESDTGSDNGSGGQTPPVIDIPEPTNISIDVSEIKAIDGSSAVDYSIKITNKGKQLDISKLNYRYYYYYTSNDYNERNGYFSFDNGNLREQKVTKFLTHSKAFYYGYYELSQSSGETLKFGDNRVISFKYVKNNNDHNKYYSMSDTEGQLDIHKAVVVYYDNAIVWGSVPEVLAAPTFEVKSNSSEKQDNGKKYHVSFKIEKNGVDIDWSNLYATYYWLDYTDGKGNLQISNVHCSEKTVTYEIVRPAANNEKKAGANGYVKFRFASSQTSSPTELITVSFDITSTNGENIEDKIKESYSTSGNEKIYGEYMSSTAGTTFGVKPTEAYVEKTVISGDNTFVISSPKKDEIYHFDKAVKSVIVEFESNTTNWSSVTITYGVVKQYYDQVNNGQRIGYIIGNKVDMPKNVDYWHNGNHYVGPVVDISIINVPGELVLKKVIIIFED